MIVNGISIEEVYNMKIYSFSYQPLKMNAVLFKSDTDLSVFHGGYTVEPKPMILSALFRNKLDISRFIKNITENNPSIINIHDGFIYECYYQGGESPSDEVWNEWYKVKFSFNVIQKGEVEHKINLIALDNKIFNMGTYKCPCIIEITSDDDIDSLTIGNYVVNNLRAGDTLTIDGYNKKVYSSLGNRFSDVEFLNNKFPFLDTGENSVELSQCDNLKISLRYREVYI